MDNQSFPRSIRCPKTGRTKFMSMPMWGDTCFNRPYYPSKFPDGPMDCAAVDSYIDGDTYLIYGDFDNLPNGYADWDAFASYCQWKYGQAGFVFRSRSNKVKIAFRVDERPTKTTAHDTLRSILGDDFKYIDTNHKAMTETFIHPKWFKDFGAFCFGDAPVHRVVHDYQWKMLDGKHSIIAHPVVDAMTRVEQMVYRFIVSSSRCLTGLDCPQRFIADQIGSTQSEVSRAITAMVGRGILKCVDETVKAGKKAKTFVLDGILRSLFLAFKPFPPRNPRTLYVTVEKSNPSIDPGTFYRTLWAATNLFVDGSEFLGWALLVPGIHEKGRLKMAKRAWATHSERNGLAN